MKRIVLATLVLAIVLPSAVQAQSAVDRMPRPFTKRPVSQKEYVKACRDNDMKILNRSCDEYAKVFNEAFGLELKDRHDVAEYFANLTVKPLPRGTMSFCRILPDGTFDLTGYKRESRIGELGLYDPQLQLFVVSLGCGNCTPDKNQNVFTAMVTDDLPKSLSDQVRDLASGLPAEREESGGFTSFFKRNKKPLLVTGFIVVGVAVACAITGCLRIEAKATAIAKVY